MTRPPTRAHDAARPIALVVNPHATGVKDDPELPAAAAEALRAAGARVQVHVTEDPDAFARLLPTTGGRMALLGGDGSLHLLANLPGPKPQVALLPAGGANNVAASLGIPTDLDAAARIAVRGPARRLDLVAVTTRRGRHLAVEGVSVGLHAAARSRYAGENSSDRRAALLAGLAALVRFRALGIRLGTPDILRRARVSQLFAANLPRYGPRLLVAPDADPRDGLLDLVLVAPLPRRAMPAMFMRLRRGSHPGSGVRVIRARWARVSTARTARVIADAEDLGRGPARLEILPGALRVAAPER